MIFTCDVQMMGLVDYSDDSSDEKESEKGEKLHALTSILPEPKRVHVETSNDEIEAEQMKTTTSERTVAEPDQPNNTRNTFTSRSIARGSSTLGGGLKTKFFDGEINAPEVTGSIIDREVSEVKVIPAAIAARIAKYGSDTAHKSRKKPIDASMVYAKAAAADKSLRRDIPDLFSLGKTANNTIPKHESAETNEYQNYKSISTLEDNELPVESSKSAEKDTNVSESNSHTVDLSSFLPGKKHQNTKIQVVDFNADKFYEENEQLRSSGQFEEIKRPVKAVGGGKHQLSALLRSAQTNREGLEEMFAQGKKNKRESGARHGF